MGKKKHRAANNHYSRPPGFIFGLSAEKRSDDTASTSSAESHLSTPGMKTPLLHDTYVKIAQEFHDVVKKSTMDPWHFLEPCLLNGQPTVRIKSQDGNAASFPFDALTSLASDESEKKRIMKLIHTMRASVTSSEQKFNPRIVNAPSNDGESTQHDATRIAKLEAELAILRARAPPPLLLVHGVPEHSDGSSHGGCASQDKGRDGASKSSRSR